MKTAIHTLTNEIQKLKLELYYAKNIGFKDKDFKRQLKDSIREHKKAVKFLKKKK